MLSDPDTWTVTIGHPRADTHDVTFDVRDDAIAFIEYMKQLDTNGWWKMWITNDFEGTSDQLWG